jgi:hypothetical protein
MAVDINEAKLERGKVGLWVGWTAVTGLGMALGFLPAEPLAELLGLGMAQVIAPLIAGIWIGFLQWLLLRAYITNIHDWIPNAGAGWMGGYALGLLTIKTLAGGFWQAVFGYIMFGILVSVVQWPTLRREIPSLPTWIAANVLGWTAAFVIGQLLGGLYLQMNVQPEVTVALISGISGLAAGAITGAALIWIVRQPERPGQGVIA